ncbi:RrF2 family transcriptional regulator [Micromonospora rifamycinica]|uniref:Transcriptional regulator, BadM/Rrf2 family n=1 Tax=Micromonospora rifamycinica TaxID=291594 RepID=A0A109II79_9ACTN|nr:Rrf2 family transcriptional regulator [Micromonospora rifamycinica]KWV31016.1 Rrf2 family transcriptional regulator [Micromonospora rifamycinica]SCG50586.1 transcriptional regulator, BadM/Rrf2 family [Micromonospora rifamycinica]
MKLNRSTDMALRIAMLTAPVSHRTTIDELADRLDLPRSHVAKVVQRLQRIGVLVTVRGRAGGVAFAEGAERITVGRIVRAFEGEGEVVACEESGCALRAGCRLRVQLRRAQAAFLAALDEVPVGELVDDPAVPSLLTLAPTVPVAT